MKKVLVVLALTAAPAFAASHTITTTANQENALTRAMNRANAATCKYYGQSAGCTEVQARTEFCRRAGFPLVANCDGANQVDVYATVSAFLQGEVIRLVKDEYGPKGDAEDKATFDATLKDANKAKKDAACVALGLAAGCLP